MSYISSLQENQVFVFGSNASGFHGAGAAGSAFRGTPANTWRQDQKFLKAMKSPVGSDDRIGLWAVYGVARGLQHGHEGSSYAICTIERPGKRRSIPLNDIASQWRSFCEFARSRPDLEFIVAPFGVGYAGYTVPEIRQLIHQIDVPSNVDLPKFFR